MRKSTKILSFIALVLLFFPLFFTVIENQFVLKGLNFMPMDEYPLVGDYLPDFLFWTSVGFLVLLVLSLLVIIFFPSTSNQLVFSKEQGKLVVDKKALESFVLATINQEPLISQADVKVRIKRRKIKIMINGNIRDPFYVADKQEQLTQEIQAKISQLIGPQKELYTKVTFNNFQKEKRHRQEPRVT